MIAAGPGRARRNEAVDQEQHQRPSSPPRQSFETNGPHRNRRKQLRFEIERVIANGKDNIAGRHVELQEPTRRVVIAIPPTGPQLLQPAEALDRSAGDRQGSPMDGIVQQTSCPG